MGDNCDGAINLVRNSTTTGHVNIANTFKIWRNNFEFYNLVSSFNFCNNLLSTTTMNMGGLGSTTIGGVFTFQRENITTSGINDTINIFNNITTGIANIATSLTTGTCYLGGVGNIKVGNVFTFKSADITSSGTADIINVFNNITTGTINFCNGLTTAGLLQIGAGKVNIGTSQISGYSTFGTSTGNFTIPSTINVSNYLFVATGSTVGQVLTLPSYIDTQIIYIRNNKLSASLVVQCFGTQSLRLKNNGTATNITVGGNTTTILIGTSTTWYYFL